MIRFPRLNSYNLGNEDLEINQSSFDLLNRIPLATLKMLRLFMLVLLAAYVPFVFSGCTGRDVISVAEGWSPLAVEDAIVYVATKDSKILALDSNSLERDQRNPPIWEFTSSQEDNLGSVFGPPAIGGEFIYVAGSLEKEITGQVIALKKDRPSNSQLQPEEWKQSVSGGVIGGPVFYEGIVIVTTDVGKIYCFDGQTGEKIWSYETEGVKKTNGKGKPIWSTPVVEDGVVYVGSMDQGFYALSLGAEVSDSERLLWKFKTNGAVVGKALLVEDLVIFGSFDRNLYALDKTEGGKLVWTFQSDNLIWAAPVSNGETVYAASSDGKVYAMPLDRLSGDEIYWVQDLLEPVFSDPILTSEGLVIATNKGTVSLVDQVDGSVDVIPISTQDDIRAPVMSLRLGESPLVVFSDLDGVIRAVDVKRWRVIWTMQSRGDT